MEIWPVSPNEFKLFLLILIRVSVVLFMLPFFNARIIPVLSKVGLAFTITLLLFPVVNRKLLAWPDTSGGVFQLVVGELIIGMVMGLCLLLFFEGIKMMGMMVGFQTGFSITNIIDPQSQMQVSILSNLAYLAAMTFFLIMNGHHLIIEGMKESFEIIRVGSTGLNAKLFQKMIQSAGDMFVIAIKMGAPAIAALLFVNVAFGLITKLIPQMNIMIVAFPVQIVMGLLFFGICLHVLLFVMEHYLGDLGHLMKDIMHTLKG